MGTQYIIIGTFTIIAMGIAIAYFKGFNDAAREFDYKFTAIRASIELVCDSVAQLSKAVEIVHRVNVDTINDIIEVVRESNMTTKNGFESIIALYVEMESSYGSQSRASGGGISRAQRAEDAGAEGVEAESQDQGVV